MENTETKVCSKCGLEKPLSEYYFRKDKNKYYSSCKECINKRTKQNHIDRKEYMKKYYNNNKQVILKRHREYEETYKDERTLYKRDWYIKNLQHMMWKNAKRRANKNGIDFSILETDILIPDVCPVFGTLLVVGMVRNDNSPTLDRIDNSKGYIIGNIRVISWRANRIKGDATTREIELILEYMKREGVSHTTL
jgi:hypothetical protein